MDAIRLSTENIDLEIFFSLNPDLLCVLDASGNIVKVNAAWAEVLGYGENSLTGKRLLDLVHPDDRQATVDTGHANRHNRSPVSNFVNRLRHKDGSYRYIEWNSIRKSDLIYAAARDITDRRSSQETIAQLSQAVEYNPASVVITDTEGVIRYVNKKFSDVTGYTKEEAIGRNPGILKSGEQDQAFYAELWDTIEQGKNWQGIFHNRKKNGDLYWESALIAPIFDHDDRVINYVAVKEDITARKTAEDALQTSNDLLDLFFRQSLDGFFFMMLDEPVEWNDSIDKDAVLKYVFGHQRITKINKAMLDQYKAREEDFIGLTPADFYQHDPDYGRRVWREFFDNGTLHVDTTEHKFDGTPMIIEGDYICLYDSQGRITGHFGIQRDVTFEREAKARLQESEERFRQLAEHIDQVFFLRTKNTMLYVSPTYEKIWGRSCQSLYEDPNSYIDLIHPDDRSMVLQWYQNSAEGFDFEYRIVRPDGDIRWIWAKAFSIPAGGDYPPRIAGIAQDISERKRLEEQLRETSIRDALTGLYNRRHLFERLDPFVERAKREGYTFSIALLDIDHFKRINDTYGHIAGDRILKKLAEIINTGIRGYDLAGRFGGEEFLIACSDIDRQKARELMERILQTVRNTTVEYQGNEINFTFSCGVSDSARCGKENCTLEGLIRTADENLYSAKAAGRNRVLTS